MSGAKHTPGPWEYLDIGEIVRADDMDVTIAEMNEGVGVTFEEAKANASLIAAAPELLALLRDYRNECSGSPRPSRLVELQSRAAALIAKAEGKS